MYASGVHIALSFFCPDVHVEPHKKQLHVTLAYHFQASHLPVLEKLAKSVDVSSGCDWLAVLFSRDIRFANHEVDTQTPSERNVAKIMINKCRICMFTPQCLCLTAVNHVSSVDTASHVPVRASE